MEAMDPPELLAPLVNKDLVDSVDLPDHKVSVANPDPKAPAEKVVVLVSLVRWDPLDNKVPLVNPDPPETLDQSDYPERMDHVDWLGRLAPLVALVMMVNPDPLVWTVSKESMVRMERMV